MLRYLYMATGLVLTCIGIAGVILPGLPGTIFLILAAAAFARSNPRLESWLLNHPWFGASLRDWREHGSMSLRAKYLAIGTIWLSITVSLIWLSTWYVGVISVLLGAGISWYLWTRPTRKTGFPEEARK